MGEGRPGNHHVHWQLGQRVRVVVNGIDGSDDEVFDLIANPYFPPATWGDIRLFLAGKWPPPPPEPKPKRMSVPASGGVAGQRAVFSSGGGAGGRASADTSANGKRASQPDGEGGGGNPVGDFFSDVFQRVASSEFIRMMTPHDEHFGDDGGSGDVGVYGDEVSRAAAAASSAAADARKAEEESVALERAAAAAKRRADSERIETEKTVAAARRKEESKRVAAEK